MKKRNTRPFACRDGSFVSNYSSDIEVLEDNSMARRGFIGGESYQNSPPVSRLDLVQQRNSTEIV